jgi:hypothetical protein
MSRMGEWHAEQQEENDLDLMWCALAQEEEQNRYEFEQAARRFPVVITPQAFTHESHPHSPKTIRGIPGMPGVQQTISAEPSGTSHLRRRLNTIW